LTASHHIVSRIDRTWDGQAVNENDVAVVEVDLDADGARIAVSAPFHGDPPPEAPPGPTDGLWNYEVVELFLVGSRGYLEVELGPHGHYLVLQLSAPRVVERRRIPIGFEVTQRDQGRWKGTAIVAGELLPDRLTRYNAYRVHGLGVARQYLARFPVPGKQPDFHRLDCFGPLPSDAAQNRDTRG
jgi:hypothetical protein